MSQPSRASSDITSASPATFSFGRVFSVLVPIALLLVAGLFIFGSRVQKAAREASHSDALSRLLADALGRPGGSIRFVDADGNLVNDFPPDGACVAPPVLRFSYIASPEPNDDATVWAEVVKALSDATERPVEFVTYDSTREQLAALAAGDLHVTGLNTGAAPLAVAACGFVPVCTFGRADGTFGQTMKLIVPAKGRIKKLDDLGSFAPTRKPQVLFTSPSSNSGFKAALVLLLAKGLRPERDYDVSFSLGHEVSIRAIAAGEADVAPVSSDILETMIAAGDVTAESIETIYESEKFPPAVLGFASNLEPVLREAITRTLLHFEWQGTGLAKAYGDAGSVKFVPVNYKDDWANIRRIDDAVEQARSGRGFK